MTKIKKEAKSRIFSKPRMWLVSAVGLAFGVVVVAILMVSQSKTFSLVDFKRLESELRDMSFIESENIGDCKKGGNIKVLPKVMDLFSSIISIYMILTNSYSNDCIEDLDESIEYECMKKKSILYGKLIKSREKNKIEKIYGGIELEGVKMKFITLDGEGNISPSNVSLQNSKFAIKTETSQFYSSLPVFGYIGGKMFLRRIGNQNNFLFKYKGVFQISHSQDEKYILEFKKFDSYFSIMEGKISGSIEATGCVKGGDECECFEIKSDKIDIYIGGVITNEPICESEGKIIFNDKELILSSGIIKIGGEKIFCDEVY